VDPIRAARQGRLCQRRGALGLLRHSTFVLPGSIELAHREHLQIITAIRDHKSAAAERLAREHVNHALAMRLKLQRLRSEGT
jgi:DNA-binding GntR family transcriptional regulator